MLFSLLTSVEKKSVMPWVLMGILTAVQILGNVFSTYKYMIINNFDQIEYFTKSVLFFVQNPNPEYNYVMIAYITGAILPVVALCMTGMVVKMLRDIKAEKAAVETPAEEDVDVPDFFGEDRAPSYEESYPEEPTQMEAPFVQEEYYEAPSYEEPSYDEEEPNQEEPEDMDELADMEDLGAGRRRKSRSQLFKEVYLPPIIVCVSLVLVLSFTIGSVSNLIQRKQTEAAANQSQISATEDAAALKEQEYQRVLQEAELLASGYNYEAAVKVLESFGDMTEYPELQAKRAEYVNIQNSLVEHKDISTIPNLSFHVLMADPARAFKDADLGGSYNRNFVSTSEFSKILDHLYANGYVLVDFESITGCNTNATGTEQFFPKSIYLPADKKPIMLTETMVNYFAYMIDGNGDGQADAQGDGFASKLVVSGDTVKAEYVDANGQTLVGDYDFVPILETFIAEHPDFSYQGARATLAVCGNQRHLPGSLRL